LESHRPPPVPGGEAVPRGACAGGLRGRGLLASFRPPEILESFVGAALHLALVAQTQADRFGLVTFSDRTHKFVRARNGMDHFRLCREAIYNLHASRVSPDFRDVFTTCS
jgi:uncharacterized protein (DUF58 family)